MRKIREVLKTAGKETLVINNPDGSRVLIMPHGGRVLGLYAPDSEENFFWTNPALDKAASAIALYSSEKWHNSGGERTWLAPSADIFFPDFPKLDKYVEPRRLDPGDFKVVKTGEKFKIVNNFAVHLSRPNSDISLELTKSVDSAPNPFRHERSIAGMDKLSYAGYTQHTSLEIKLESAAEFGPIGLWNLVQMPHNGEMLFPTFVKAVPRVVFGDINPNDIRITEHLIRYKMHAKGEQKIAIRALPSAGRIGYVYQSGDKWALVVRNFFINPSGEYVEVPWEDTSYFGFTCEACNVNSGLGSFSELEYHIPAIGRGTRQTSCTDTSVIWAFRGTYEQIKTVCGLLLTSEAM